MILAQLEVGEKPGESNFENFEKGGGQNHPQNWNLKKRTNICRGNLIKNRHIKFDDPSSIGSASKIGGTEFIKF